MAAKKGKQVSLRLTPEMGGLVKRLMGRREVASFPEYIRGLILLDAGELSPRLQAGHTAPAWITRDPRYRKSLAREVPGAEAAEPLALESEIEGTVLPVEEAVPQ